MHLPDVLFMLALVASPATLQYIKERLQCHKQ